MNDASGEKIDDHIRASEPHSDPHGKKLPKEKEYEPDQHLNPSRWWFASSAFPMMAGTLGPAATAFSICAFSKPWRQNYPPGSNVDDASYVKDPAWLLVINAVQLLVAVIANISLLLNMTRRLRFSIAQPVTIFGWYISAICLIALTATASGPLVIQPKSEYIWSQAFYYGVYAAILYFFVATLMLVTFIGAINGHYPKDFVLTPSQRTLMIQTILLLFYLLMGALVFGKIENWDYLDAVYWATVTLFTVGFGDYHPDNTLGRALLIPFALIGIISLGLVIGSIRSLALDRGRRRLSARMVEKKRRQMLRELASKGEDHILEPVSGENSASTPSRLNRGLTEYERREQEFKLMRQIQHNASRKRRWYALAVSSTTWLTLWLVGARLFQQCEASYQEWSYMTSVYFTFISLTTIGYGDVTPKSNAGKSFWVFWALLALPTMTVLISNAGDTVVKTVRDLTDSIATLTILPGDKPFKKELKGFLAKISCGILFKEDIEMSPTGFHGDAQPISDSSESSDSEQDAEENQRSNEGSSSSSANPVQANRSLKPPSTLRIQQRRNPIFSSFSSLKSHASSKPQVQPPSPTDPPVPPPVPPRREDYHVTLLEEIARVTSHLKHHPPKKYSFHEWAWFLRLIGEDEGDSERHKRARNYIDGGNHGKRECKLALGKAKNKDKAKEEVIEDQEKADSSHHNTDHGNDEKKDSEHPWAWGSWVGSKSPLMGEKEEAEWILERLIERLGEELRDMRAGKAERDGGEDNWEGGS
ncbi:outward-rectifier potassium channel TOK1 [Podospora fimiseda]|uniref:Outward-rectifier potassium channel TOK1 n=1 Tax=Podospora fimiseda TaxID=252190 RepID=A0AAN7BZM0_9PEZI|nr:outward-rectifier potassium channel TOK1 [Podospora fimiseda]